MLKTRPKQLLGSLPLDIALPGHTCTNFSQQDETWAEFSTLEVAIFSFRGFISQLPNLKLKTAQTTLGFLP